jgi:hypothetical protein
MAYLVGLLLAAALFEGLRRLHNAIVRSLGRDYGLDAHWTDPMAFIGVLGVIVVGYLFGATLIGVMR